MKKTVILCLISICALGGKIVLDRQPLIKNGQRKPAGLEPVQAGYVGTSLKKYSLGFDNFIGATLWIQLLQLAEHTPLKSGMVSWEFAQLDAITELDPRFESAYDFGSIFVSSFRRDKLGGKIILEKWQKRRPSYWRTNYLLGLHYLLQMNDKANAAPLILKASTMTGAPQWISALGIRLLSETGALLQSLKLAISLYPAIQDSSGEERLTYRMRSLNYNLQKNVWIEALDEFKKINKKEPASLEALQPLLKSKARELASSFADEKLDPKIINLLNEKFAFRWNAKTHKIEGQDAAIEALLGKVDTYEPPTSEEKKDGK
jgi:hypothetical protein